MSAAVTERSPGGVRGRAGNPNLFTVTYNDKHQQLTAIDAAGQTTTYTYDPTTYQLLTVTTPPTGANPSGVTTTYIRNASGQVTSVEGPGAGRTTTLEYDGYGRLWRLTDSEGYAVTTQYDALDRVTTVTYPDGTYEETDYDKLDAVKQRDRLGRWTQTFYDALRRPVATRDPAGRITQRNEWVSAPAGCGGCGGAGSKVSKLIDANGSATTWEYDLEGRVTQEVRANSATYNYTYENTTSRLASRQDPNGSVETIAYNRDNTTASMAYQAGVGVAATPNVSFTYDSVYNRVATMTDGTGTTNYAYYPVGVLGAGKVQTVDGPLGNDTITYNYDELGHVNGRQIGSSGNAETYAFDSLGRLAQITNPLGDFTYAYDGVKGRPLSVTYPNGQQTAYAYFDNTGDRRLQEIWNKKPDGSMLSKFDYTYNAVGNILTWQQQAGSSAAQVYQLGYDGADQLTSAILQSTDPTPVILKRYYYGYDPAGNRTAAQNDDAVTASTYNNMNQLVSQAAGGALTFKGTVSEPATVTVGGRPATVTADNHFTGAAVVPSGTGQVAVAARDMAGNLRTNTYQVSESGVGASYTYDANGNLTSDGTRNFAWDARNQLSAITAGTSRTEFSYDGLQRRVRIIEKQNGVVQSDTRVLWCEWQICEERASDGVTVLRRAYGRGEQVAGVGRFFAVDHLHSVTGVADGSGSPLAAYAFDPWGQRTLTAGTDVTSVGFTGHRWQANGGLWLSVYRAYDAGAARWLSEDPIGVSGGPNLYNYVRDNPIGYRDELGRQAGGGAAAATAAMPTCGCNFSRYFGCCGDGIVDKCCRKGVDYACGGDQKNAVCCNTEYDGCLECKRPTDDDYPVWVSRCGMYKLLCTSRAIKPACPDCK